MKTIKAKRMIDKNGLDQKREVFAQCVADGMSQSDAFRTSHPGSRKWTLRTLYSRSSAMAAEDKVSTRVAQLRAKAEAASTLSRAEVLNQLRCIIFSDVGKLVNADGTFKSPHELDADTRAAISSIEIDRNGVVKYKFWDKNVATEKAMKHLGLYEINHAQKSDPLGDLLTRLSGNVHGVKA